MWLKRKPSMTIPPPDTPIRALLIDLDGVMYVGQTPIPGAAGFIRQVRQHALPFLFLSNNPTLTPAQYAAKLGQMGVPVEAGHFWTSALATATWLRANAPPGTPVLVVGESGLRHALIDGGMTLVEDWRTADWVVASLDRQVTWRHLADAALAIQHGACFVATNADLTLPSEEGALPGGGALVSLLQLTTGVTPLVIGKPQRTMFEQALQQLGCRAAETLMVGDRYETDIVGAQRVGLRTAAVLTGVTRAGEFAQATPPPDWVFPSITGLGKILEFDG